jgi:uncharacterized protein YkwD
MLSSIAKTALICVSVLGLAACTAATTPLPQGLTASMATNGAALNRAEALGLLNQYRAANNLPLFVADPALNQLAERAAAKYAAEGNTNGALSLVAGESQASALFSAGYDNFADTFSGWRGAARDVKTLSQPNATTAGLAVKYDANSNFGTHWVLLVSP